MRQISLYLWSAKINLYTENAQSEYTKAAAWRACSKLTKIWKSSLSKAFKLRMFTATVESVLLYGSETWTLTVKLAKSLDGMYTRMLRTVLNVHWQQHVTNQELYGKLPKLSDKIRQRRVRFAGHCSRSTNESVSNLVHWTPKHGKRRPGKPALTYRRIQRRWLTCLKRVWRCCVRHCWVAFGSICVYLMRCMLVPVHLFIDF